MNPKHQDLRLTRICSGLLAFLAVCFLFEAIFSAIQMANGFALLFEPVLEPSSAMELFSIDPRTFYARKVNFLEKVINFIQFVGLFLITLYIAAQLLGKGLESNGFLNSLTIFIWFCVLVIFLSFFQKVLFWADDIGALLSFSFGYDTYFVVASPIINLPLNLILALVFALLLRASLSLKGQS